MHNQARQFDLALEKKWIRKKLADPNTYKTFILTQMKIAFFAFILTLPASGTTYYFH